MSSRGGLSAAADDIECNTDSLNDSCTANYSQTTAASPVVPSNANNRPEKAGSPVRGGGGGGGGGGGSGGAAAAANRLAYQHGHSFVKKTFHKPTTTCHYCAELLWGLRGPGYICEGVLSIIIY